MVIGDGDSRTDDAETRRARSQPVRTQKRIPRSAWDDQGRYLFNALRDGSRLCWDAMP